MDNLLTGGALLEKLKSLPNTSRRQQAIACGYIKNGKPKMTAFYEAIANAEGLSCFSKTGKEPSFIATPRGRRGGVFINAGYLKHLGLEDGDAIAIEIVDDSVKQVILSVLKGKK